MTAQLFLPRDDYRLLLVDPPWAFRTFNSAGRTPTAKKFASNSSAVGRKAFNEAEDHYPTMSFDEMAALPVADVMAKDSLCAMWAVGSHLDEAIALGLSWGFTFVTDLFVWLKQKMLGADQIDLFTGDIPEPRISMGYHTRKQCEQCLLFKRGKGLPVLDHSVRQVIIEPAREHSRKPDCQYDRLQALYGAPAGADGNPAHLEMFARQAWPGWDAWGNQTDKFERSQVAA